MEKHTTRPIYYFMLIAVLILGGLQYFGFRVKHTRVPLPVIPVTTPAPQGDLINPSYFQTKKIQQTNQYTTVDIEYPEFINIDNKENRKIYDFYMDFIAEHNTTSQANLKARFDTDPANTGKDFSKQNIPDEEKFGAYAKYTVFQENDNFISVLLSYGAFQGGAHGFEDLKTINYDVKNKKMLTLRDILAVKGIPESDIYTFLSEESRKQLLKKFAPDVAYAQSIDDLVYDHDQYEFIIETIYDGTQPVPENFTIYTFTPDELTIYFGQYQVASYADGEQQVKS
jgi:hypothetical protein